MKKMETVLTELYFFVIFFCFFYKKTEKALDKVVEIRIINQYKFYLDSLLGGRSAGEGVCMAAEISLGVELPGGVSAAFLRLKGRQTCFP
ncbi:MAG: hypothetical protein IKB33_02925 [Spirochaetaceae bacterium]|nr:hypothetical protein [Spirochaetaceae bacterium]